MKLLEQLIIQIHLPAQLWKPDGTVLYTNAWFNELFGLPPYFDWAAHHLSLQQDPQIKEAKISSLFDRAFQGSPVELHSLSYDPGKNPHASNYSGGPLQLFISILPVFEASGEIACLVCLVSDYAPHGARFEQEMMRTQKMENVEKLASGIAHEFNNIFTGIQGLTQLIKDESDTTSEVYEFAGSILQNITRGVELIQQLSNFASELPYTLRPLLLSEYISQALPLLKVHVQDKISIETDIRGDGMALIDSGRMDQALANIVDNAKDAMGGEGKILLSMYRRRPKIDAQSTAQRNIKWAVIEVADSGPGIAEELRERVLEPFYTTKERGKATGLGLSVLNRIVLLHNGVLQIGRSEELGGAAIRIFLPLIPEEEKKQP